jgi:hypothetical protein
MLPSKTGLMDIFLRVALVVGRQESIECFKEDQAFSPSHDPPPPIPIPVSRLDRRHTGRLIKKDYLMP